MIRRSIQALTGIVLVIGLVFKFMHYPGAAVLLGSAILGMTALLLDRIIQHRAPKLMSRHNISCMLGIIYLLAVAFKVFHLPGAGIMLMTSMVGLTIVLIQFAFSIRSSKYAILPALYSITLLFALFRIMHWPEIPHVLYGSYFIFAIALPFLLFSRGQELKKTHGPLSKNFLMLGLLTLVLLALEIKLRVYPEVWGTPIYQLRIVQTALVSAIILAAQKTIQSGPAVDKKTYDYQILRFVQGAYLILLVMLILVARNH